MRKQIVLNQKQQHVFCGQSPLFIQAETFYLLAFFSAGGASTFVGALTFAFFIQLVVCSGDFEFYSFKFCVERFCLANESFSYMQSLITPLIGAVYLRACVILEMSLMGFPFFSRENSTFVSSILPIYSRYSAMLVILVLPYTYKIIYLTLLGDYLDLPIIITPILCIPLLIDCQNDIIFDHRTKTSKPNQFVFKRIQELIMHKMSVNSHKNGLFFVKTNLTKPQCSKSSYLFLYQNLQTVSCVAHHMQIVKVEISTNCTLIINIKYQFYHMPNLLWRTHPRKFGKDSRECRRCKCQIGLIRKYDLLLCRKCFRENGEIIGFTKTR